MNNKITTFFNFTFLCFPSPSYAQINVSGNVKSIPSNTVPKAKITFTYVSTKKVYSTVNDTVTGYYSITLPKSGTLQEKIESIGDYSLPKDFELNQNYPNPFNPTTIINYSVPNTNMVTIKVYDQLGKQVATLVNEEKPAGNYFVNFNASKLSSGVYFYRMQAGSFVETKKLILMK